MYDVEEAMIEYEYAREHWQDVKGQIMGHGGIKPLSGKWRSDWDIPRELIRRNGVPLDNIADYCGYSYIDEFLSWIHAARDAAQMENPVRRVTVVTREKSRGMTPDGQKAGYRETYSCGHSYHTHHTMPARTRTCILCVAPHLAA